MDQSDRISKEYFKLFYRFLEYLKPWRKWAFIGGVLIMVNVILQIPMPLLTRYIIDHILPYKNFSLLNWVIIGLVFFMIIKTISGFLSSLCLAVFRENVLLKVQMRLFQHIQHLSLTFHNNTKTGYLLSRIANDSSNLQGLLAGTMIDAIQNILIFCVGMGFIFFFHWKLALVSITMLPFFIYSIYFFASRVRKKTHAVQESIDKVYDTIAEGLSGIMVTKSFCLEQTRELKLLDRLKKSCSTNIQFTKIQSLAGVITAFLGGVAPLLLLWYGGQEIMRGNLTLGTFFAFNSFLGYLYGPAKVIASLNTQIQSSLVSLKRIFEILDIPSERASFSGALKFSEEIKEIEYQNVIFSYNHSQPVLNGVSFKIKAGEKVAFVGPSGAGKTTLLSLLPRFYEINEGKILINKIDIRKIDIEELRMAIGIVPQETFLFDETIEENIRYGKVDATKEEVVEAAKAANIHNFIEKLPDKYNTMVGERGVRLSGGERQRIAIARAILKNPKILIMDEATSEIDSTSEKLIREAMENLMKGRTTLIIAHRLFSILHADRIILVDKGKVIGEGTHESLYETSSLYKKLYKEQFSQ